MTDAELFIKDCEALRRERPMIVCITNYVAMNISSNALLAIGASPIVSFCTKEIEELVRKSSALLVNIGCLDSHQSEAIKIAANAAHKNGIPWILDPVGAGVSKYRKESSIRIIKEYKPSVIRANAAEVLALTNDSLSTRSLDADSLYELNDNGKISSKNVAACPEQAMEAAGRLARETGCIVSMSGKTDVVTDGKQVKTISNGSPLMASTTAIGCTAGAVTAAFAAVDKDPLAAALNAMALMGTAGELAASMSHGTGSFQTNFLDVLSEGSPEEFAKLIRK